MSDMSFLAIKYMKIYNDILENKIKTDLRLVYYSNTIIKFNNGLVLNSTAARQKFIKRIKKDRYYPHFSEFYSNDENVVMNIEKIFRKENSSIGGKANILKNGDKFKDQGTKNLINAKKTGKCWEKARREGGWSRGKNKNNCEIFKKMSEDRKGSGNPMFGKTCSEEKKKKLSENMKNKILNNEFTPNIHNRLTHFSCIIGDKKFRSSWEGYFYLLNPSVEYEKLRISYNFEGKEKIYIVDFIDNIKKEVYEVKPKRLFQNEKSKTKEKALIEWCEKNNYTYKRINEQYIIDNFNEILLNKLDERNKNNLLKMINNENKKHTNN